MEIAAALIELKPDSAGCVQAWAEHIRQNRSAAEETLSAEGITVESWLRLSLHGKEYLLCYIRAASLEHARRVASKSDHPIDLYHQAFKKSAWVPGGSIVIELLVDLTSGVEAPRDVGEPSRRSS